MNKKQVVFLEPWTTPMIYKMARMLKKRGYYTISIRVLKYNFLQDSFFNDGFDEIISFNQSFNKINLKSAPKIFSTLITKSPDFFRARKAIKKLNPYVIICRTPPNWLCMLTRKICKNTALIYFPYDIRAHGDPRLDGYNIAAAGKIERQTLPSFEIKAEKYCFENCDGIIHKGGPEELKYLDKRVMGEDFKICQLQLHFPPYCSEDFIIPLNKNKLSKKDGEIHIVTAESSGSSKSAAPAYYVVDYAKELIKQKIHLHIYLIPNVATPAEVKRDFEKHYGFLLKSKYFHFQHPVNPKKIITEMSKYDYGIILASLDLKNSEKLLTNKFSSGNKLASYMESGIPCINYRYYSYMTRIIKKYNIGIVYNNILEIKKLKRVLNRLNYKQLENNILKARKDFLMENHFNEFESFIKKAVENRRLKNENNN